MRLGAPPPPRGARDPVSAQLIRLWHIPIVSSFNRDGTENPTIHGDPNIHTSRIALTKSHASARGRHSLRPPAPPAAHRLVPNSYRVRCRSCHHFWTAVSMSIAQTASTVTSNPTTTAFVVGLAWSE